MSEWIIVLGTLFLFWINVVEDPYGSFKWGRLKKKQHKGVKRKPTRILIPKDDLIDIEPSKIFQMFLEKIHKTRYFYRFDCDSPWTVLMENIFREIGEELGYRVMTKRRPKEWLAIDQVWKTNRCELIGVIEYENTSDIYNIIDDEIEKMLDTKASIKILVYYPTLSSYRKHLGIISKKVKKYGRILPDEKLLVIMISYVEERNGELFVKIHGYEFDHRGNWRGLCEKIIHKPLAHSRQYRIALKLKL